MCIRDRAKDGVIPAPYALEEGEQIIDQYLEPVIFHLSLIHICQLP